MAFSPDGQRVVTAGWDHVARVWQAVSLPQVEAWRQEERAAAEQVKSIADLEAALVRARTADRTTVIVIETDPLSATTAGGAWWDVPVAEVSTRPEVKAARQRYAEARQRQRLGG